jgi:hypothetical protein
VSLYHAVGLNLDDRHDGRSVERHQRGRSRGHHGLEGALTIVGVFGPALRREQVQCAIQVLAGESGDRERVTRGPGRSMWGLA